MTEGFGYSGRVKVRSYLTPGTWFIKGFSSRQVNKKNSDQNTNGPKMWREVIVKGPK